MQLKYYKEDDILVIKVSEELYDHAEMSDSLIVHFTKDKKPVRLEILNASKFFDLESKALPKEVKETFFVSS